MPIGGWRRGEKCISKALCILPPKWRRTYLLSKPRFIKVDPVSLELPGMAFPLGTQDTAKLWPSRAQEWLWVLGLLDTTGNFRFSGRARAVSLPFYRSCLSTLWDACRTCSSKAVDLERTGSGARGCKARFLVVVFSSWCISEVRNGEQGRRKMNTDIVSIWEVGRAF